MKTKRIMSIFAAVAFSAGANAGLIFQDNFDSEAGAVGNSVTNYNSFNNWTASHGTVDVVSNGGWGIQCAGGSGKCVDLDGSSRNAGKLTSTALILAAGKYSLSFDISGNQRNSASDRMTLTLGGFLSESFVLKATAPWQTITRSFTVKALTTKSIVFNHAYGDNIGIMLDNVSLSRVEVPEPATLSLLGLGLVGLGLARRRKA